MDLEREARTHLPETRAVDLKAVIFMDSAGVALLVEWKRRAERSHRQLDFLNLPDQAKSIARLSNALVILGGG